jgi:hypothetical protein
MAQLIFNVLKKRMQQPKTAVADGSPHGNDK